MRHYFASRPNIGTDIVVREYSTDMIAGRRYYLPQRSDLKYHDSIGFDWGNEDMRSANLSLCLLADVTGDDVLACELHRKFMRDVIAGLDRDQWVLHEVKLFMFIKMYVRASERELSHDRR